MFRKKNRTKQKSESWLTIPNYSRIIHAQKYQKPSTFCQYFCKPIRDCYKSTATALGCGKLCVGSVAETTTNNRLAWEAKRIERWQSFDRFASPHEREREIDKKEGWKLNGRFQTDWPRWKACCILVSREIHPQSKRNPSPVFDPLHGS